ncbi:MAG TPA: DUF6057 family protein [Bacteroidales bacterium]|nr:DUF6057 family protein [Bacteroidales bacterium]
MIKKVPYYGRWIFFILLSAYIVHFIFFNINPIFIHSAQQTSFYINSSYFDNFLNYPGAIAEYCGSFIGSIYGIPFWGSLVAFAMIILSMIMFYLILSKIYKEKLSFLWMAIPAFLMLSLMQDYYFPPSVFVKAFFLLVFVYFSASFNFNQYVKLFLILILSLSIYYTLGSTILVIYLISILCLDVVNSKQHLKTTLKGLFYIVLLFIIPYLGQKYFFNIADERTWKDLVPVLPPIIKYTETYILNAFIFSLPVMIIFIALIKYAENKFHSEKQSQFVQFINNYSIKPLLGFIVIVFIFLHFLPKQMDLSQKQKVLTAYFVSQEKWEEAINTAIESSDNYDYFININFNRAIYNNGQFANRILDYPQLLGISSFYPDANTTGQITIISSDLYYELGYIGEALHWAYEGLSILPWNQHLLKRLVMCNLIEGNTQAASTYLSVLKDAAWSDGFYDKYIAYLSDTSLLSKDKEIAEKRQFMPNNSLIPNSITHKLKILLAKNNKNQRALEYLAICYLLDHKIGDFMLLYPELKKIYPEKMPQIYELGVILYCYNTDRNLLNQFTFSKETQTYFVNYSKIMKKHKNNKSLAQIELKENYQNTYLYYLSFLSPLVTKMEIKKREVKN